nr:capsular biosynthesis protein [Roseobacter sp. H9]
MTLGPVNKDRVFLFLQGPHGPFFWSLAEQLRQSGAQVRRVGFNAGDRAFWFNRQSYIPFRGTIDGWPDTFVGLVKDHTVTDVVLYGDTRPVHAQAIALAKGQGLRVHVFEEGYLRPYWVTYEQGGANGHSSLMALTIDAMQAMGEEQPFEPPIPPGHWGDMRQHVFYGALYHWFVLFWNKGYPRFQPHRALNVAQEFKLYLRRLLLMPFQSLERMLATFRIRQGSFPYHLALLQLEHDSSFQMHGPFQTQSDFLDLVIEGFAKGAPVHHHLVFKAHPLEDGRVPVRQDIKRLARRHGIADRVHYVRGGKLAGVLTDARSAVTVNSTAGQQVLWRGIPLRAFGAAVYNKPELVSHQSITDFFADPARPDARAYRQFRDFLLATSQLPGSYYARKGRRQLLRQVTDLMLQGHDPYALPHPKSEAVQQQLRVVR